MSTFDAIMQYGLAKETSLIIGVIGLALAIIGVLISLLSPKKQNTIKIPIVILCIAVSLCSIILLWNYYTVTYVKEIEIVRVPDVEDLSYGSAQMVIRISGLHEKPVSTNGQLISADQIVLSQDPAGGTEIPTDSLIILRIGTRENTKPNVPDITPSKEHLAISIDSLQETETYHYEYPDPQNPARTILIDLGKGMSGTFSYSRPLTEEEKTNWYHGGKLYDEYGNEVGQEGNWPTFWSDPDGRFAFEFPMNLSAGRYTYELYQDICGQIVSDTVEFVVK